jgi:hypothetical protein
MPLQFSLQRLRSVFVLPVIIFLVLVPSSVLASFGIIFFTFTSHQRGDFLWFDNRYVELGFPKNWYGAPLENINSTSGNTYSTVFIAQDVFLAIGITIYDRSATQTYIDKYNLANNTRAILVFESNRTYHNILESSSNATLEMVESGTRSVSGYEADYSIFLIRNSYVENNVTKNISFLTIFYFADGQLVQIAYWGSEEAFVQSRQTFDAVLNQLSVKT